MDPKKRPLDWDKVVQVHKLARDVSFITNAFWTTQPSPMGIPATKPVSTTTQTQPVKPTSGTVSNRNNEVNSEKMVKPVSSTSQTEPVESPSGTTLQAKNEKKLGKKSKATADKVSDTKEKQLAGGAVPPKEAQVPFVFRAGTDTMESAAFFLGVRMPAPSKLVATNERPADGGKDRSFKKLQAKALESQEKPPLAGESTGTKDVGQEQQASEEASVETKKKAKKKKKKKKKAEEGSEAEGLVDGSSKAPQLNDRLGREKETIVAAEHSVPSKEPASLKASDSQKSCEAHDLGPEQANDSTTGEETVANLSDSDAGNSIEKRADADDWEHQSEWAAEDKDTGGPETSGVHKEKAEWGELEEDDVEQLLLLGKIQHEKKATKFRKVAPAHKKPAPPPARPKSATDSSNKVTSAKQPGNGPFRSRGSPSEYITLPLPDGPLIVNRGDFDTQPPAAKFFVIKSNSVDDVHKSIKYGLWASTSYGNNRLHAGFQEAQEEQPRARVFLLFSVNASGRFCGMAEMTTDVDFSRSVDLWREDNQWNGQFRVIWHIIKDVPHRQFWHIKLASNEDKPVTSSRDTQEVPYSQGVEMLGIFQASPSESSILDYFALYDTRQALLQEERERAKLRTPPEAPYLADYRPELPARSMRPSGPALMRPPFPRPFLMPFNAKTKLCERFSSTGVCNYGERCFFAHGMEELRPFPRGPPPQGPPFFPGGQRPLPPLHPDDLAAPFFPHVPGQADMPFHHKNGMPFHHPRPPGFRMPPPEYGGHLDGHPHGHHFPPFGPSQPMREPEEPLPGPPELRDDDPPGTSLDEKEAQDEYLLRLLINGGDPEPEQETAGNSSATGLAPEQAEGSEHDDEEVCCICFERMMDAVLVPCTHALCRQCADLMQSSRSSCPVCNAEIEAVLLKP